MRHVKKRSLDLAETIYPHVHTNKFTIIDLRNKGIIPQNAQVGSTLTDLKNNKLIESIGVNKKIMMWKFTPGFVRYMEE